MDPVSSREPARSFLQTPGTRPAAAKFGALDAWAFDVPRWADFSNASKGAPAVPGQPYAAIADEAWMVYFQVGENPGR